MEGGKLQNHTRHHLARTILHQRTIITTSLHSKMKGDPVDCLDDSDIWFECKDHPGTNEFRRVIRFVAEDFQGVDYSRTIYKAIRKELRGRKFVTGETQEDLREVPSRVIVATIGTAFEAEQERRERRRKKRKRERQKYHQEAQEEDASSEHGSEKKERTSKDKKHHKEKKNKVEAEFDVDDIEQQSRRKGSSTAATEDIFSIDDKLQTSSRDILDKDSERDDLQDTDNGKWRFRVSDAVWFLVIVALAVTAWKVGTQVLKNEEEGPSTSIDWTTFADPREGNASQVSWPSQGGQGIALEVLNAADESWDKWIELTVSDWDHGDSNIDPLSLTITRVERDINCTQVEGKIKLCNGDYGETQWRGLNDLVFIVQTSQIVSSAARLNEWYLQKESDDQKLYTVCHELGTSLYFDFHVDAPTIA
jgi:hypothetical protein